MDGFTPPGSAAPFQGPCRFLVSLDYDGTLRRPEGVPVPLEFFRLMEQVRPFGVRWGINTGRSLSYLLGDLQPCSPVLPDFICTCERYVYMADATGTLQPAAAHNATCQDANLELRARFRPILHSALDRLHTTHPDLQWCIAATDPLSIETPDAAAMELLVPHIAHLSTPEIAIQRAGRYLRFSDARFSKGTALRYVVEQWGVPEAGLFLMGDGHNDLDAFQLFPQAWCAAPADAHPEVSEWLRSHGGHVSPEPGVLGELHHWFSTVVAPQV